MNKGIYKHYVAPLHLPMARLERLVDRSSQPYADTKPRSRQASRELFREAILRVAVSTPGPSISLELDDKLDVNHEK